MDPAPMWTRNSVYGSSLNVPDEVPGIRPLSRTLLSSSSGRLETCGLARVGTLHRSADNRVSAVSDENGLKCVGGSRRIFRPSRALQVPAPIVSCRIAFHASGLAMAGRRSFEHAVRPNGTR